MSTTALRFQLPGHLATGRAVRVLLIGLGGTGSEMLDALMRLHYVLIELGRPNGLELFVQDGDEVARSNVGRQRFLPSDCGLPKAQVLAERYGFLYGVKISYLTVFAKARHIHQMDEFDLVITAVDKARFRTQVARYWRQRACETLWLDCGNGAQTGQVVLGHLSGLPRTGLRLPNVFDLYPALATVNDDDEPSCSLVQSLRAQRLGINRFMADAAVFSVLTPLLTEGSTITQGAYVDCARPSVQPMRIDPAVWRFHGYEPHAVAEPLAKPARRSRRPRSAMAA